MNEHRKEALASPDTRGGETHALVYVGDQIGELIDTIKGLVKVGNVAMSLPPERIPRRDDPPASPKAKAPKEKDDGQTQG